jgi:hypothetical protein
MTFRPRDENVQEPDVPSELLEFNGERETRREPSALSDPIFQSEESADAVAAMYNIFDGTHPGTCITFDMAAESRGTPRPRACASEGP